MGGPLYKWAGLADPGKSFRRTRRHERRAAQSCFRGQKKRARLLPDNRPGRFDHCARVAISFRESDHFSDRGSRAEVLIHVDAFARRAGRAHCRISAATSELPSRGSRDVGARTGHTRLSKERWFPNRRRLFRRMAVIREVAAATEGPRNCNLCFLARMKAHTADARSALLPWSRSRLCASG